MQNAGSKPNTFPSSSNNNVQNMFGYRLAINPFVNCYVFATMGTTFRTSSGGGRIDITNFVYFLYMDFMAEVSIR